MQANDLLQSATSVSIKGNSGIGIRASTITVWLLILMPLTGLIKGITGNRYSPLVIDTLLLAVFTLCLGANIKRRRFDLLDLLLLTFLLIALLQMFNSNVPSIQAGVEGFRKFAFMSIAFYLGRWLLDAKAIRLFQSLLMVFSVLIAIYGIRQFFYMSAFEYRILELATAGLTTYMMGGYLRPFSILPGPFHLGLYLIVSILWLVMLLVYSKKPIAIWMRMLIIVILIIEVLVVFLTRTKSSWFGLAASFLVILVLQRKELFSSLLKITIALAIISITLTLSMSYLPQESLQVLADAISAVLNISEAPTFNHRENIWEYQVIPAILENPFWGFGTSSSGEGLAHFYESTLSFYVNSHNLYLKILIELGVVGFLVFFAIVFISLKRGARHLRRQQFVNQRQIMTTIWALAVVFAFFVAGLAVPVLDAYPPNYYFWLVLGILAKRPAQWL
jgi:O-antigen ligase